MADREELYIVVPMGDLNVEVYLGSKPKFGIAVSQSDKYIVPGEKSLLMTTEFKKDATESSHPRKFFTEIVCTKLVDVPQELSNAFHAKDQSANNKLLSIAEQNAKHLKTTTDLIAGTIGLRFHRQFVIEVLNENFIAKMDKDDYTFNFAGPGLELLENITLNPNGTQILDKFLQAIGQATPKAHEFGASTLLWLLHAWNERDTISKFMALFIPIEIILAGYGGNQEQEKKKQEKATQIRNLLTKHGGADPKHLLSFFNQILGQQRPSLASRFYEMAKESQIEGWEADVVAFKRFNSIRNKLLHQGKRKVQLTISVGEQETRQLEDIAERYVSWTLFRDGVVYQSRWRPQRSKGQKE
ncbi:MAG: hypothetical protein FJ241_12990 [Nitrospira sp.]|nr:hypothetical protein [Nitrospira sp.]